MAITIRPLSTIKFIGLSETNTIDYIRENPDGCQDIPEWHITKMGPESTKRAKLHRYRALYWRSFFLSFKGSTHDTSRNRWPVYTYCMPRSGFL
jgi:hypothetical protein